MDAVERWNQTWSRTGVDAPAGLLDAVVAAYGEPHRAYHTLTHLDECFGHLDACPVRPSDPVAVELALWFHDAVYDTKAPDNEAASAAWARAALPMLGEPTLDRIEQLILVTRHDGVPDGPDQQLLLDVDLSILGAPAERFDEYEAQVRREYEWVPEDAFRAARARILAEFEQRERLYHTAWFHDALEARARGNLQRSLEALVP